MARGVDPSTFGNMQSYFTKQRTLFQLPPEFMPLKFCYPDGSQEEWVSAEDMESAGGDTIFVGKALNVPKADIELADEIREWRFIKSILVDGINGAHKKLKFLETYNFGAYVLHMSDTVFNVSTLTPVYYLSNIS